MYDENIILINSCRHMKNAKAIKLRFSRVKSQLCRQENRDLMAFFMSRVCRTIGCQCLGLMTRNQARFMSHGAVDLCKVLQKTGKRLRLAFDSRYECLIDELHSLADSSTAMYGYKGSLTTRGSLCLKGLI